jgi:putative ABC transport system substrate-binding protein
MNRRETLIALLALAAAAPHGAHGQQPKRIILFLPEAGSREAFVDVFRAGLREQGWTEGRDIELEVRWTSDETAEAVARTIVASVPAVIVAPGGAVASPLRRLGTTLPVVFVHSGDPIDAGLVQSFARPGGNFTGMSWMSLALVGKRLETLREIAPRLRRVAVFADPRHAGEPKERAATKEAAGALGLELRYYPMRTAAALEDAMASTRSERCEALDVFPDGFTLRQRVRIAEFAKAERLMSISGWVEYAEAGFLASYGVNRTETIRRLASYVTRILRGASPSDLPVELPTIVESAVNLKTARALGLTIPRSVLARADRVID